MNVLLISYYFPPADFGATNRLLRIMPYLAERGLRFYALTVKNNNGRMDQDDSLLSQIVACEHIVRTGSFEPFKTWDSHRRHEISLPPQQINRISGLSKQWIIKGLKPLTGLARRVLAIPDSTAGWYPFAVQRALQLCKQQNFDLIFSTVPGQTAHLVAKTVASNCNLPWVADFRDDWFDYGRHYNALEFSLAMNMLRGVILQSSALTFTSLGMCELYKEQFPEARKKMWFIPHGVIDLPESTLFRKNDGEYWVGYIGTLDKLRDPSPLIKALEWVSVEAPEHYQKLHIKLVGSISPDMENLLNSSKVADRFDLVGFVSREESVQWMRNCDVLLLLLSDISRIGYGASASKIYDYLAVQKPILAIVPIGNISILIERTRSGKAFRHDQIKQIGEYLIELAYGKIKVTWNENAIEDLRAEHSAAKLWQVFQDCIKK